MGVRLFPVVAWAERGGYLADGHGNSVPRFHVTWGTGPAVLAPFERRVREASGPLGDGQHPPVDVLGHPADHALGRPAEPGRPVLPDQVEVAAEAARAHQYRRRVQLELPDFGP
jgi:hypothetical protein